MQNIARRLGFCVICGSRVHSDDNYFKSSDGYCHRACLNDSSVTA